MAKYVSVKGWIECEDSQLERIQKTISSYETRTSMEEIFDNESMKFYNKGWCYPKEIINWTSYIFYGADIKEYYLGFIQDEIKEILKENIEIDGMFFFCNEEGEMKYWRIMNSKIMEEKSIITY